MSTHGEGTEQWRTRWDRLVAATTARLEAAEQDEQFIPSAGIAVAQLELHLQTRPDEEGFAAAFDRRSDRHTLNEARERLDSLEHNYRWVALTNDADLAVANAERNVDALGRAADLARRLEIFTIGRAPKRWSDAHGEAASRVLHELKHRLQVTRDNIQHDAEFIRVMGSRFAEIHKCVENAEYQEDLEQAADLLREAERYLGHARLRFFETPYSLDARTIYQNMTAARRALTSAQEVLFSKPAEVPFATSTLVDEAPEIAGGGLSASTDNEGAALPLVDAFEVPHATWTLIDEALEPAGGSVSVATNDDEPAPPLTDLDDDDSTTIEAGALGPISESSAEEPAEQLDMGPESGSEAPKARGLKPAVGRRRLRLGNRGWRHICPVCIEELTLDTIVWQVGEKQTTLRDVDRRMTTQQRVDWLSQNPKTVHKDVNCLLPHGFGERHSYIIGIVGVTGASKSHLLYAIVKALLDDAPFGNPDLGILFPRDEGSWDDFRKYYASKAEQREPLPTTLAEEAPHPITVVARRGKKEVNLIFVDASGDLFANTATAARNAKYAYVADMYLFLVPPAALRAMPTLNEHGQPIPEGSDKPEDVEARHVHEGSVQRSNQILDNVAKFIRFRREDRGVRPEPLVAIALAKADLLAAHLPATAAFDPFRNGQLFAPASYRDPAAKMLKRVLSDSEATRDLLDAANAHAYVDIPRELKVDVAYFTVAATGEATNANGRFTTMTPLRVLDPIVWLLAQLTTSGEL